METETNKKTIEFDVAGKRLGRVASEIAVLLMGKNEADYAPNKVSDIEVVVLNVNQLDIPESRKTKTYQSFSGYPGGLKTFAMDKLIAEKGMGDVLKRAVNGMLPKNKLQKRRMKNLIIKEN